MARHVTPRGPWRVAPPKVYGERYRLADTQLDAKSTPTQQGFSRPYRPPATCSARATAQSAFVQSLSEWKTAAAGRMQSKALPEPTSQLRDVQVRPDRADTETTGKINGWAAQTCPVTQSTSTPPRARERDEETLVPWKRNR